MRFKPLMVILMLSCIVVTLYILQYVTAENFPTAPLPLGQHYDMDSAHFLIHTPGCTIPDFDVMDPTIAEFKLKKPIKFSCGDVPPLSYTHDFSLHINQTVLNKHYNKQAANYTCCYQGIRRINQNPKKYTKAADKKYNFTEPCLTVHDFVAPNIKEDGIFVNCMNSTGEVFYKDVHMFVQPKRAAQKIKRFQNAGGWPAHPETLSFIILGNDGVSRLNLKRHMPKTFKYITEDMDAVDFKGFNKIADNTDPNLIAILMGLDPEEYEKHACSKGVVGKPTKFDDCPLIWKEFSKKGYVTADIEDAPNMSLFHYLKLGFVKEPTDYYNRPYAQVSDKNIGHSSKRSSNGKICQGSRKGINILLEYALTFTEKFNNVPYFSFFWSAAITHDHLTWASMADEPNYDLLKKWNERDILNNTILLFMSDHGQRWGPIRTTYIGMLEERLPYVMMVFPKWFKNKYPETWRILKINTRRLVTNHDLYLTMKDVLNNGFQSSTNPKSKYGHGQSLFKEIPRGRTCKDASVPEHYCACQKTEAVDIKNPNVQKSVEFVIKTINKGLQKFGKCSQIHLTKVFNARRGSATNNTMPTTKKKKKKISLPETYSISFSTNPGNAYFEATLSKQGTHFELSGEVSRINVYGNQSHCITDNTYKKYCYCKDLLNGVGTNTTKDYTTQRTSAATTGVR